MRLKRDGEVYDKAVILYDTAEPLRRLITNIWDSATPDLRSGAKSVLSQNRVGPRKFFESGSVKIA